MTIHVLIVDDHAVVRQGLKMFLMLDKELEVVGEAANGQDALTQARLLRPDVVLMDLIMPVVDGITAIKNIRGELPAIEVIALTTFLEDPLVVNAIKGGAIGYLLKDVQANDLCQAIKAAAAGQVQLSSQVAARLMHEIRVPDNPETLTDRETEVLRLLAMGKSNREISADMYLGETTVKTHVSNILMKLGVSSRTQAALFAIGIGLVTVEKPRKL
jgi:two-component system, NarL family, response regulator LiaR